jgi:dTDP-4-dehydrorhamnose reductase
MKLLVIGSDGQLGSEYIAHPEEGGYSATGLTHSDIEISDMESINNALDSLDFDILVNTAAYHGYVAYNDKSPDKYMRVNVIGPAKLAAYAERKQKVFVHFSTDYVFSGNTLRAEESFAESDIPWPSNLYSLSKYFGELIVPQYSSSYFIFRVASIYGVTGCRAKNNSNFVDMILTKLSEDKPIEVVDDIVMSPTSTRSIVEKTLQVLRTQKFGLYHLAGSGSCSWYDFAVRIALEAGYPPERIKRASTKGVKQDISRGNNTSLTNSMLKSNGFGDLKRWDESLHDYIASRQNRVSK